MSTTNEDLHAEIKALKKRIEQLELDIAFMKAQKIQESFPVVPQPWVSPSPQPYWQNPIVTYCVRT